MRLQRLLRRTVSSREVCASAFLPRTARSIADPGQRPYALTHREAVLLHYLQRGAMVLQGPAGAGVASTQVAEHVLGVEAGLGYLRLPAASVCAARMLRTASRESPRPCAIEAWISSIWVSKNAKPRACTSDAHSSDSLPAVS